MLSWISYGQCVTIIGNRVHRRVVIFVLEQRYLVLKDKSVVKQQNEKKFKAMPILDKILSNLNGES